jgi:hypothetical protein
MESSVMSRSMKWEGRLVGESVDSQSPCIGMLGLEDRLHRAACFFIDVIWVKDSSFFLLCKISYSAPEITMQ